MFFLVYFPMLFRALSTRNDLGHLPNTQGYAGPVSWPSTPTQTLQKLHGGVVTHKILATAQRPNSPYY